MLVQIDAKFIKLTDCTIIRIGSWFAVIDTEDAYKITPYHWYVRKTFYNRYAYRKKITNNKEFFIFMHRQIMHCPNNRVVHHKNRNGLDNRKNNLVLMTKLEHDQLHRFR